MTASPRWWTTSEDKILRENYPQLGAERTAALLFRRTRRAVLARAQYIGLRYTGPNRGGEAVRKHRLTPEMESCLRELYATRPARVAISEFVDKYGVPRWWVTHTAQLLGIARSNSITPGRWSEEELAILEQCGSLGPRTVHAQLRAAGHRRTLAQVADRMRRSGLPMRPANKYAISDVATLLGHHKSNTVNRWIDSGWLEAEPVTGPELANVKCWIDRRALREFVVQNPNLIDLRLIRDNEWFIDLLAGVEVTHKPQRAAA